MSKVVRKTAGAKKKKKTRRTADSELPSDLRDGGLQTALQSTNGQADLAYERWRTYLQARKTPTEPFRRLKKHATPLLWSVDKSTRSHVIFAKSVRESANWTNSQVNGMIDWVNEMERMEVDPAYALNAVGCASLLPELTQYFKPQQWSHALVRLVRLARQSCIGGAMENPWISQLLVAELPLTLACRLPEIPECVELAATGIEQLDSGITDLCDGQGMPIVSHLRWMPKMAACWTRSLAKVDQLTGHEINADALDEFDWFIRNLLRIVRRDGGMPFDDVSPDKVSLASLHEMIASALAITNDKEDMALAKVVLQGKDVPDKKLPEDPGYHSEWSQLAVLQSEWAPSQPRLTVDFSTARNELELSVAGQPILRTAWDPIVVVDGQRLEPQDDDWESVCWFSDFDVDFLELELEMTRGWRIQRQYLMARQDGFLYLADNLLGPMGALVDYRVTLPFSSGCNLLPAEESREGYVHRKRKLALVLPLSLPEWRSDGTIGEMQMRDGAIQWHQTGRGSGLNASLFFDFHSRRLKKAATWRSLTVAERLEIVPRDQAVGYRIHVGPEQWLVYRSLNQPANRTVLGQNFSCEFNFGRFLTDGDFESLVEIE